MTNATAAKPDMAKTDANKQAVLRDIQAKWDRFSPTNLASLTSKDDLVTQVAAKYGQDKSLAQREVDAVLRGRTL